MTGAETPFNHFESERDRIIREARELVSRHKLLRDDHMVKAALEANFIDADGNPVEPKAFLVARFKELERAIGEIGREFSDGEETGGSLVEHGKSSKY